METGPDGTRLKWEDEVNAQEILGCPKERLPKSQSDFADFFSDDVRQNRLTAIHNLKHVGDQYRLEYQLKGLNGQIVWVVEIGEHMPSQGPHLKNGRAVLIDISARKFGDMSRAFENSDCDIPVDDILSGLNERRFRLAYQPIVDADNRMIKHYEALLRIKTDSGDLETAVPYILAAENHGLVHLLDQRALELVAKHLFERKNLNLAVNLSAKTIKNDVAMQTYIKTLKTLGPATNRLIVELTETAALKDPQKAAIFSDVLHGLGGKFAVDDFGAGHTSFRNLMAMEVDMLKIDGSLIKDIATQSHQQVVVAMITDLAQTFDVKTVAEHVDNDADAEWLQEKGVDYFQGFLFGAPDALPDFKRQAV